MARAKKVDIVEEPKEVIEEITTDVVEQAEVDELTESTDELTESADELTESADELTESADEPTESADEPTESVDEPTDETVADVKTTKKEIYVYIGPSLPNGALKSNTTLNGSLEEIKEHYKVELEKYPKMSNLIVTTGQLNKCKKSMQDSKSLYSQWYKNLFQDFKQR